MSKLLDEFTRERLGYYANLPTQPFGDDASVFMYEVRKLACIALEMKDADVIAKDPINIAVLKAVADISSSAKKSCCHACSNGVHFRRCVKCNRYEGLNND